jgi:gliding motility-associated-like protein
MLLGNKASSQDFSNRGTDFWTGYGPHEKISSGVSDMTLYFTSDNAATVTIYIGNTLFQTLNIPANSITASNNISEAGATDARLQNEGVYIGKGIYIHSTSPIVAYAQIWGSKVTATTILFPLKTLGRKYTSLNFTQISNTGGMRSYAFAIATEDATTIEVKPSAPTSSGLTVGAWTSRTLNKGDVWLIKGGTDATDLTGTQFRSVSSATSTCKPIAVFSGSQKISVTCTSSSASGDNFFQQCFPVAAWGRKFVSAPTAGLNYTNNIYRVMINPDSISTVVKINGVTLPGSVPGVSTALTPFALGGTINMTNSLYYEFATAIPVKIESTSPVMVAQYISNRDKCGNNFSSIGDPDMIYISPVEQTVDTIIVSPVPTENNDAKNFINVNIKTADVPGFSIRNQANTLIPATFTVNPADPLYSYAQIALTDGYSTGVFYKLKTISGGFNAIAYGYATSESYAYNAGTNVKNLNHYITSTNPLSTSTTTKICKGTPTRLSVTLAYIPSSVTFSLFNNPNVLPNANVTLTSPVPNTSYVLNGTTLYVFYLPGLYTFNTTGLFPVKVSSNNPSPDGCNGLEEVNYDLEVFGGPLASFDWTFAGCASNPVSFNNQSTDTTNSTINQWQWDFGDASGTAITTSPTYTYASGGAFNVHLTVVNSEGCFDDTTRVFTIENSPTANFTVTGTSCTGNTLTFTDQSSIINGTIVEWKWDFADFSPIETYTTTTNPTHTFLTAGTYRVTLVVKNASGCTATHFFDVVVGNRPVPNFVLPGNVCLPSPAVFNNTSTVSGGGTMTYLWSFGDASPTSTDVNPSHIYSTTGPFNVTLTASLGTCSMSIVKEIFLLFNNPVALATAASSSNCLNTNTVFTGSGTAVSQTIQTWSWTFGDGGTSAIQNPTHLYATAGTFNVNLTITTNTGCVGTVPTTVSINPLPTASFTVGARLCEAQAVTFSDVSVPNAGNIIEWQWNFGDGNQLISSNSNPVNHTYLTAGNYTVTLIVKTDNGCISAPGTQNITINATPVANFVYPSTLCNTDAILFTNTSTISDGTAAQMTCVYDFGDASTSNNANPNHTFINGGQYNVTLTTTSNNGCAHTVAHLIDVYSKPTAAYTINNVGNVCSNTALSITNLSNVIGFGSVNKIEIYWDFSNNITDVTVDNAPVSNQVYNHNYTVFGNPLIKTYRVLIKAYSGAGCSNEYYTDIDVHAAPDVVFNSLNGVCQEIPSYTLTAANNTTTLTGTGVYSGNGIISSSIFDPSDAGAGLHTITYTFTGDNGCIDAAAQSIEVYPTPLVNLGPDRNVLEGDQVTLSPIQLSGNILTYLWTPNVNISSNTVVAPICTPRDNDVTYVLNLTTTDGCKNKDDILIKVVKDFIVPNTFTPNGDGINDKWTIENLYLYPNYRCQVFTRSGQLIFDSKNQIGDWDGNYKGKALPTGTYYYIIDLNGIRATKKGYITIIR